MLPSLQSQPGQLVVRVGRGRDHDDIDARILDHLLGAAVGPDAREVHCGVVARLGVALHDGVQPELGDIVDEGDLEDLGAEAVAYDADVPRLGGHGDGARGFFGVTFCDWEDYALVFFLSVALLLSAREGRGRLLK